MPCCCCCFCNRYETALAQLQEEQRQIDRRVARGGFRSKDRDIALQVRWAMWSICVHEMDPGLLLVVM